MIMGGTPSHGIDRHYVRNTAGISAAEALWGLALPVLVESTFLQLFLKHLGASDVIVGLMPGLLSAGVGVFALLAALLTSHLPSKRRAVIITHISASVPILAFGLVLIAAGTTRGTVNIFIFFYALFALAIGVTLPVWQNFIVSIFTEGRMFRALSVMLITQITCRFLGGLILVKFVERYSFSDSSMGACFITVALLLFAGSFFFLLVREERTGDAAPAHTVASLASAVRGILGNRDFVLFQLSNIDIFACVTVITFYASYAVECRGVDRAVAAGLFIALIQAGAVASNVLFGWFNLLAIKSKYFFAKSGGLSAVAILLAAPCLPGFLAASFLIGMARGVHNIAYSPAVKLISGRRDATDYFSVTPLLMLPFSFGIPFASGIFLNGMPGNAGCRYPILFAAMGVLVLASAVFLYFVEFGGKAGRVPEMTPVGEEIAPLE